MMTRNHSRIEISELRFPHSEINVVEHFETLNLFLPLLEKNLQLIKDAGGGVVDGGNLDSVQNELLWIHRIKWGISFAMSKWINPRLLSERFGKFDEVLEPGCHFLPWCLGSQIAGHLSLRLQQLDVRCENQN